MFCTEGELPGIRAGYSLCVDIVTHLFTSMIDACSHIYLEVYKRLKKKKKKTYIEKVNECDDSSLQHC